MKKLFTIAFLLFGSVIYVQAQDAVPMNGYTVSLSENTIKLSPGESKQITISLLRSKGFSNSKATLGLSSPLPTGVAVGYEPSKRVMESSVATITASKDAKEGQYQVILKSTLRSLEKGTIVKVIVEGSAKNALTSN